MNTKILNNSQSVIQILLNCFDTWGVNTIFAIPGSHIDEFLIQAIEDGRFEIVIAAHEQGAGYMADGFARVSDKPGVVVTINGPGATNLTTAAVTARLDYSPVLFLTGDVPTFVQGFDAFQTSEVTGSNTNRIFKQAVTHSFHITDEIELSNALQFFEKSLQASIQVPIHLNLPSDIAKKKIIFKNFEVVNFLGILPNDNPNLSWIDEIPNRLGSKIAILVGEEVKKYSLLEKIGKLSEEYKIPVAATIAAKNIQPFLSESLFLGIFGYSGVPKAFHAILDSGLETLIIFGAALDERNTVAWNPCFLQSIPNIISFSANHSNNENQFSILNISCSLDEAIYWLSEKILSINMNGKYYDNRITWIKELETIQRIPKIEKEQQESYHKGMSMIEVVSIMNKTLSADTLFFLDSGDHRIYGATYWDVKVPNSFHTAAKTAPMGWAIGAAIGASFVHKDKQVCVLTGDGCMLMHGLEISVAARYKCQVLFIVSNNSSYGRVATRMENDFLKETLSNLPKVSWSDFARNLGVQARKVTDISDLDVAIEEAKHTKGPFVIEIIVNLYQQIPYKRSIFSSSSDYFTEQWKW